MTLEEKIGQLVQYSFGQPTGPNSGRTDDKDMIRRGQVGSLFNVKGARETNALQRIAVEDSRLHIPLIFGMDVIHGYRTTFPVPLGLAATWSPEIVEQAARVAAQESSAAGVYVVFSPMVDIARDARWGRMIEGAEKTPILAHRWRVRTFAAIRASAWIWRTALQRAQSIWSATVPQKRGVITTARKFLNTLCVNIISRRFTRNDAGAVTFMAGFNAVNGIPSSANPFVLKQVLRHDWGFKGFVVSDWNSVGDDCARHCQR